MSDLKIANGSNVQVCHLCPLMQMIFDTGILPSLFCSGDLAPIPKKGKSESQYFPFRPITVFTTLCKLFELLLIDELRLKCYIPPQQFGYQDNLGCTHAITAVFVALASAESSGKSLILAGHDIKRAVGFLIHSPMLLRMAKRGTIPLVFRALRVYIRILECV